MMMTTTRLMDDYGEIVMMMTGTTGLKDEYRSGRLVSGRAPRHTRRKPQVTGLGAWEH